jgi:predicted GIY-YIG superfamily endonuclease
MDDYTNDNYTTYNYIVYLLINTSNNCTYVGITNNPEQRIRKHNGIISGGAKYTKMKKQSGIWTYYGFILDLDKSSALSIEKKIHIHSRKTYGATPLEKRINCINNILKTYDGLEFIVL